MQVDPRPDQLRQSSIFINTFKLLEGLLGEVAPIDLEAHLGPERLLLHGRLFLQCGKRLLLQIFSLIYYSCYELHRTILAGLLLREPRAERLDDAVSRTTRVLEVLRK